MCEHGVDDTRCEDSVADIPVHQHPAVELGDLRVQQHLRALGNDPSGGAELLGDFGTEQFAEPQRAGEHHRRQNLGAAMPAEVAQHRQPRVSGMGGGGPHGVLHDPRARNRGGRTPQVDVQQQRRGEVAHQAVDVGVQRLATEQGDVQQKPRGGRPARQGIGECRGHRHRRCDAAGSRKGEQRVTSCRVEPVPPPGALS